MENYAIIKINSKQFFVEEGSVIKTHKIDDNTQVAVLLAKTSKEFYIGTPVVEKVGIQLANLGENREKTVVRRYKSKSRYRKNKSHTDTYVYLKVLKIDESTKTSITKQQPKIQKKSTKTKQAVKAQKSSVTINDLKLSTRALNALKDAKITNVSQLKGKTAKDLAKIKGLGEKTASQIVKKLK